MSDRGFNKRNTIYRFSETGKLPKKYTLKWEIQEAEEENTGAET